MLSLAPTLVLSFFFSFSALLPSLPLSLFPELLIALNAEPQVNKMTEYTPLPPPSPRTPPFLRCRVTHTHSHTHYSHMHTPRNRNFPHNFNNTLSLELTPICRCHEIVQTSSRRTLYHVCMCVYVFVCVCVVLFVFVCRACMQVRMYVCAGYTNTKQTIWTKKQNSQVSRLILCHISLLPSPLPLPLHPPTNLYSVVRGGLEQLNERIYQACCTRQFFIFVVVCREITQC